MKATLEFNLPQDSDRLTLATESEKWHQMVYDIRRHFDREMTKAESSKEYLSYMQVARYIDKQMEIQELVFKKESIEL